MSYSILRVARVKGSSNSKGIQNNDFSNNLKENDKTKGLGKFLDFVQDNVHEYEQDQQQARQKGMDMER